MSTSFSGEAVRVQKGSEVRFARRLECVSPFRVVELLERAKVLEAQGREVVHLEVGEPDFPTAEPVIEAGHRALREGRTKYTQALGIPELREQIARHYRERLKLDIDAERVVVTAGASAGLLLLAALLLDPGDELLLTDPGYPCNEVFVHLVNGVPVRIPLDAADGFALDRERVERSWSARTRGLLVASPANPTGAVLATATLRGIAESIRSRGGFLVLDEIYQGLTYDDPVAFRSGLEVADDTYILNSFSKYFGMTGWRLGWMVVPAAAVDGIARLAQNLFISPPSIAQHAAIAAFSPQAMAQHEQRRVAFCGRRDLLADGLERLGFRIPLRPAGAFYLYTDIAFTGMDSLEFCRRLLEESGVAATPGIDFGTHRAGEFVRFAFTTSESSIRRGLARLEEALARWGVG
jgi:aspartate/methionine/tyrosine aminotransferase